MAVTIGTYTDLIDYDQDGLYVALFFSNPNKLLEKRVQLKVSPREPVWRITFFDMLISHPEIDIEIIPGNPGFRVISVRLPYGMITHFPGKDTFIPQLGQ